MAGVITNYSSIPKNALKTYGLVMVYLPLRPSTKNTKGWHILRPVWWHEGKQIFLRAVWVFVPKCRSAWVPGRQYGCCPQTGNMAAGPHPVKLTSSNMLDTIKM